MHIPDGYLSPETCGVLYATSAPFWYVALRRVKKALSTPFIPLISVFSAFSFVIMMFNLPLPGGTTGHAVGMGVAAIVLGPWAAILAISTALVIQALFFGDGGITAIGANCFNMAIVGSLVAYGVYRLLSSRAGIVSKRRVVAAALAGYIAINVSALVAAIEFGVQPLLFHDATGMPLYCPYPLSISVPAMMIGHLTFAGLAELVITAGVVGYLQRVDPALLKRTAPNAEDLNALDRDRLTPEPDVRPALPTLRRLWIGLGLLLVLTPLGILAVGSAWGEWTAHDFADPDMRHQISAASGDRLPPLQAPRGLARLSSLWAAPLSRYAPAFIRSPGFGYLVSAAVGVGLIVSALLLLQLLPHRAKRFRPGFIEKTVRGLGAALEFSVAADHMARSQGVFQKLDPRVKFAGIAFLVITTSAVHKIDIVAALFAIAVVIATASHVPLKTLSKIVWIPVLAFSGLIALPAVFVTAGTVLYRLPLICLPITRQGLATASLLILRVETAATFSTLLVLTTEWARVLRALRFFKVPLTAVVILEMTYRYVFLLLRTAHQMFESRNSRLVGTLAPADRRRLAGASIGVLLSKSFELSTEVHSAMRSRGFQGEVHLLDDLSTGPRDWLQLGAFTLIAASALILGR